MTPSIVTLAILLILIGTVLLEDDEENELSCGGEESCDAMFNETKRNKNVNQDRKRLLPGFHRAAEKETTIKNPLPQGLLMGTKKQNQGAKKICLISDSICGRINTKEFNRSLKDGYAYRKKYPGQTPKEIGHNCKFTLEHDRPDTCIIHVGTNSLKRFPSRDCY